MQSKTIDYAQRYQQAVIGMVRELLTEVAEEGLPGAHHFFISFDTRVPGVELSPALSEHYPDVMTIVLQNQFWGLLVDEAGFSVTLRFGGIQENLVIPWDSIVSFADPSAEFGLQFEAGGRAEIQERTDEAAESVGLEESVDDEAKASDASASVSEPGVSAVLDFEKFKKR